MFWDTEQTKSFAVSWLKSILLYNYGAGNKRRWEMSYSRVSLFSLLAKSRILSFTWNSYMKENVVSSEISIQNKAEMSFQMKWHRTYFRTRESEDFLGFRLRLLTPIPSVLKNRLRLPTPTPAVLKNRLRLQHFWKPDSDSSNFKKSTPTLDSDSSWKHATPPTPTPDSDSTTLAVTAVVAAGYL